MAQDDYFYEIQLTNKQLVFYFLAGATGLVLSFLAGVMVGRGVDQTASADAQRARPVAEDRIVSEEPDAKSSAPPATTNLNYSQRLEGDKTEETLEKPGADKPAGGKALAAASAPATVKPAPATVKPPPAAASTQPAAEPATTLAGKPAPPASTVPATTKPAASSAAKSALPAAGSFTIQVGAFKDRASADSIVERLKKKGFAAYVVAPEGADGGLFNVRVGSYPARADAERVQAKLRDDEKFKPFIVRQ